MKKPFDVRTFNEQQFTLMTKAAMQESQKNVVAMAAAIDRKYIGGRKVTAAERLSLKALVSYAAANTNMIESAVADRLCALCGAIQIEDIDADQYNTAIVFLVDFNGKVH
jgi:hypothetical protein